MKAHKAIGNVLYLRHIMEEFSIVMDWLAVFAAAIALFVLWVKGIDK